MAVILAAGCRSDPMAIEGEDAVSGADVVRHQHLEVGSVLPVVTFSAAESPEGIALDRRGNVYVGLRQRDPATGAFMRNQVVRIDRDGGVTSIADLGPATSGGEGVLGLATDRHGAVYAAFASGSIATRGVYRIVSDGSSVDRLAGSEGVTFPNGLAFDARGRLYATDSFDGAVWRYASGGAFEKWIQDPLLAPVAIPGFPPLPGVNGVVFRPGAGLFISNTSQGSIVRIDVLPDGSAGDVEVLASGLLGVDGIAARPAGPLYVVNAGANLLGVPALIAVNARTGNVAPISADPGAFDDPTSVVVGRGRLGPGTVFVVNSDVFAPTGTGSGVVQIIVR
jgi:hypothetical protein